jgi:hypothetical protein
MQMHFNRGIIMFYITSTDYHCPTLWDIWLLLLNEVIL